MCVCGGGDLASAGAAAAAFHQATPTRFHGNQSSAVAAGDDSDALRADTSRRVVVGAVWVISIPVS